MNHKKIDSQTFKNSSLRSTLIFSGVIVTVFIITVLVVVFTNKAGSNFPVPYTSINGILMVIQILAALSMTVRDGSRGVIVATVLLSAYIIYLFVWIRITGSFNSIPGIGILVLGIIIIWVTRANIKRIQKGEEKLFDLAYNDSLTGLPNRRAFDEKLIECIRLNRCKQFALAVIDIDNFKGINDTKGHECGDAVLREVAARWSRIATEKEFLARQGGDEFIIIVKDFGEESDLTEIMRKYLDALSSEIVANKNCFYVSASFGLACYPFHAVTEEKLFRYADMAMYQSKISKTDKIKIFDISMVAPVENEYLYDRLIRANLAAGSFELVYQPQYKASTHELRGFETLIRMKDDYGRYINPDLFIPYAEKSRLIIDIDRWILNNALKQMRPLLKMKNADFMLSINISALHLQDESLFDDIALALIESDFPSRNLEIEITETTLVSSVTNAVRLLNKIKKLGIKVALDDFGTGYASMSNLSELPVDMIKIDKVFMDKMLLDTKYKSFVAAIISIAHIFNYEVISEGIEYEIQLEVIKQLGCDYVQGFLWGKPLPVYAVEELLKKIYRN